MGRAAPIPKSIKNLVKMYAGKKEASTQEDDESDDKANANESWASGYLRKRREKMQNEPNEVNSQTNLLRDSNSKGYHREIGVYAAKSDQLAMSTTATLSVVDGTDDPQKQFVKRLLSAHQVVDELLMKRGLRAEDESKFLKNYEWVPIVETDDSSEDTERPIRIQRHRLSFSSEEEDSGLSEDHDSVPEEEVDDDDDENRGYNQKNCSMPKNEETHESFRIIPITFDGEKEEELESNDCAISTSIMSTENNVSTVNILPIPRTESSTSYACKAFTAESSPTTVIMQNVSKVKKGEVADTERIVPSRGEINTKTTANYKASDRQKCTTVMATTSLKKVLCDKRERSASTGKCTSFSNNANAGKKIKAEEKRLQEVGILVPNTERNTGTQPTPKSIKKEPKSTAIDKTRKMEENEKNKVCLQHCSYFQVPGCYVEETNKLKPGVESDADSEKHVKVHFRLKAKRSDIPSLVKFVFPIRRQQRRVFKAVFAEGAGELEKGAKNKESENNTVPRKRLTDQTFGKEFECDRDKVKTNTSVKTLQELFNSNTNDNGGDKIDLIKSIRNNLRRVSVEKKSVKPDEADRTGVVQLRLLTLRNNKKQQSKAKPFDEKSEDEPRKKSKHKKQSKSVEDVATSKSAEKSEDGEQLPAIRSSSKNQEKKTKKRMSKARKIVDKLSQSSMIPNIERHGNGTRVSAKEEDNRPTQVITDKCSSLPNERNEPNESLRKFKLSSNAAINVKKTLRRKGAHNHYRHGKCNSRSSSSYLIFSSTSSLCSTMNPCERENDMKNSTTILQLIHRLETAASSTRRAKHVNEDEQAELDRLFTEKTDLRLIEEFRRRLNIPTPLAIIRPIFCYRCQCCEQMEKRRNLPNVYFVDHQMPIFLDENVESNEFEVVLRQRGLLKKVEILSSDDKSDSPARGETQYFGIKLKRVKIGEKRPPQRGRPIPGNKRRRLWVPRWRRTQR